MAVAATAIFTIYVWAGRYWIDLIDEGYFVYLASRVHAGDLPYRDFDTYYTPGIFYLFSWTFSLFGLTVEPIRVLMSAMRVGWALLLYGLTRRVAPWPFALLPFLVTAAVDAAPVFPEPHPSWPSMLVSLGAAEAIVRHQVSGRRRWIVLAGALAGLAFAFKQNVGAFVVLAIGAYVLLHERRRVGRLLLAAQGGYGLALAAAATVLLRPGLSPQLGAVLWVPLLVTIALLLWSTWRQVEVAGWTAGLPEVVADGVAAGAAFVAVTLAWLVPLTLALGPSGVPWGLFVGQVNQGALILALDLPTPGTRPALLIGIWLPIATVLLGNLRDARPAVPARWLLLGGLAASLLALALPTGPSVEDFGLEIPGLYPWLSLFEGELGTTFNYLPALAAWAGLAMLASAVARRRPVGPLGWYLLIGTLLHLSLYPRVDAIHAMFAGPILLVVGAGALALAHRTLVGRAGRPMQVLVYLALLVVPVAAVLPHTFWRFVTITNADPRSLTPDPYVDLGLDRAPVRVPRYVAVSVRGAVEYVQAGTPPGAPFFAYPVAPLFHFLADRPNPTRFNHFIAGALTPADLQEVIRDLDRAKPRYILWDHGGAVYFDAQVENRVLIDYIWRCYGQVANFSPYLILERRCP